MKRVLLALLLALCAPMASASTFYVSPTTGSNNNAGTSEAAPWQTIAKANTSARAGDVVYLMPGVHSGVPNPDSAGNAHGATSRITFIGHFPGGGNTLGSSTLSLYQRDQIVIPAGVVTKPYVSLKGVRLAGDVALGETADRDTLQYVNASGGVAWDGADYSVLDNANVYGSGKFLFGQVCDHCQHGVYGSTVSNSNFPNIGKGVTSGTIWLVGDATPGGATDSCTWKHNVKDITVLAAHGDPRAEWYFNTRNCLDYHNITRYHLQRNMYDYIWKLRDSVTFCTWKRDSFFVDAPSFGTSNSNHFGAATGTGANYSGTIKYITVDSSLFNGLAVGDGCDFYHNADMQGWTVRYTTIAMNGAAWEAHGVADTNLFDHCTLVGHDTNAGTIFNGAVVFLNNGGNEAWIDNALTIKNSIIMYNGGVQPCPKTYGGDPRCGSISATTYALAFDGPMFDPSSKLKGQKGLVLNNNLYWVRGFADRYGDLSVCVHPYGFTWYSQPGDSSASLPAAHMDNHWTCDSLSRFGSPCFVDSSQTLSFNPSLTRLSYGINVGSSSSDAGAVDYSVQPHADIQPAVIQFSIAHQPDSATVTVSNANAAVMSWNICSDTQAIDPYTQANLDCGRSEQLSQGVSPLIVRFPAPNVTPTVSTGYITLTSNDGVNPTTKVMVKINP